MIFKGCGVAITTPFTPADGICFDAMAKHIEYLINNKTDAIIACGTTGESATLSFEEKINICRFVVERVSGRIPVIAGSGSNCTQSTITLTKAMEQTGVDGFMIVTPYYNKVTQPGLVEHFSQIAKHTSLPIILYNVPSRTTVNMLPATVAELAKVKNIVGVKEACGDISQIAELFTLLPKDFAVYSGNDDQVFPIVAFGGAGSISVTGNIVPDKIHNIVYEYEKNKEKSLATQLELLDLIKAMFIEINPIPIKYALWKMELSTASLRGPLTNLTQKNILIVDEVLKKYGLI